jgi:hypothetical protein
VGRLGRDRAHARRARADATIEDPLERATPVGWAAHCGRPERLRYPAGAARLSLADALVHGPDERALDDVDEVDDPDQGLGGAALSILLRTVAYLGHAPRV